jgi:PAS domain S-box-containing protein
MDGGIQALLVDDDPAFTDLTATYLERVSDSITTHTETTPADAISYVRSADRIDCVVSDYNMPRLNGLELFEEIRDLDPDVPFILFTGRGSEEIASEAISAGVTDYLQKDSGQEQYEVLANRIENVVAQYRAEREAAETNQQLAQVIDRISDAFFSVDRDWTIDFINEQAAEYTGADPADLVGTDLRSVLPEERAADFHEVYERAFETQEPETFQAESALRAGTWIEERVFPAEDGLSVYFRDVTDRVEMETEVARTNQKITALHDVATEVSTCSTAAEIFDFTIEAAEEVLEFDLCAIDKVEDGCLVPKSVSQGLVSDGIYREMPVQTEDNLGAETYRTGESARVDDLQAAGYLPAESDYRSGISVPVGTHGVFQAVSSDVAGFTARDLELAELLLSHIAVALNRFVTERELRAERDRFATLFENIPHAVGRGRYENGEPVVDEVNPTFERVFGVDGDEIVGSNPDDVVAPPDPAVEPEAVTEQVRTEEAIDGREVRREAADGVRDFLLHTVTLDAHDEEVFAIYTDISEQKQRERELERQNERLEDFASVLSHDLENPLNAAYGHLELVTDDCTCGNPEYGPLFDALDRMDSLIEDVLRLARNGSRAADPEVVDVADVVNRAWQTARTDGCELVLDGELATLEVDPGRFRETLENLFSNAAEHVSGGVTVRVGSLGDGGGFYVEDDGPGIPETERDVVFERGYTTSEDGTGFGLAIVDTIAAVQGWEVRVTDAEHAPSGARFEILGVERDRVEVCR